MSMDARWQKARVTFWGKLQLMPADSPARMVYEASAAAFAVSGGMDRLRVSLPLAEATEGFPVSYAGAQDGAGSFLTWCAQVQTDIAQLGKSLQEV